MHAMKVCRVWLSNGTEDAVQVNSRYYTHERETIKPILNKNTHIQESIIIKIAGVKIYPKENYK